MEEGLFPLVTFSVMNYRNLGVFRHFENNGLGDLLDTIATNLDQTVFFGAEKSALFLFSEIKASVVRRENELTLLSQQKNNGH